MAEQTVQLPARQVLSIKNLTNSPLSADDIITITSFNSSGLIDGPSWN